MSGDGKSTFAHEGTLPGTGTFTTPAGKEWQGINTKKKETQTMMIDFPKADPVERGCGQREQGGVYAECGLSPYGSPLEDFLIDPPQPLPEGLDLINKPQLWEDPATGITHLLIWIGAEHYQW